jgi:hypothetical protein
VAALLSPPALASTTPRLKSIETPNPASFAARALIALAVEATLAASTIAWQRRKTARSAQAPAESL